MTTHISMAVLQALAAECPAYEYSVGWEPSACWDAGYVRIRREWLDCNAVAPTGRRETVFIGTQDGAFALLCRLANPKETP